MKNRRDFLASASVGGVALYANARGWFFSRSTSSGERIENHFFVAWFDTASGQIQVELKDGTPFLRNARARAVLVDSEPATSDPEYQRSYSIRPCQDSLGTGRQISARCVDLRRRVDFEVLITLYDGRNAVVVEVACRNASNKDLRMLRIEPVRAVLEEGGDCGWADAGKALTNGYLYSDPGRVEDLGQANRHAISSMWNMGFYRGASEDGLVIGYLENNVATGRVSATYDHTVMPSRSRGGFSLVTESLYNVGFVVRPGATVSSGKLIFNIASDPFTALETYAQAVADTHQAHLNPIVNGWCSWYYSHEYISEDEVLRNTEFAARQLKQYGMEFIQIDAGWFRTYGDWQGNENFRHGMKWLAEKIREHGLRAGIWLAPYCIAEGTETFLRHPDWLITDNEGKVKQCGGGLSSPQSGPYGVPSLMKKIYGLDITHPGSAAWLRELLKKISADWGYEFVKVDFVEWTLLSAERYHDPAVSQAAAYRLGTQIIRDGIGPGTHLLDCGPMNHTVGLLDSARIEQDLPRLTWEQYTGNSNSNAPAMAKRYYFNRKTWTNDADHLGLSLLTLPQARAAASVIALSGGTMISGDRLVNLDPDRLEILRRVYPSYGVAARPVDLFETDRPEIFELPIQTSFAEWSVVALFNYANGAVDKNVPLDRLRLPKAGGYLAFEFWTQTWVGEFHQELNVHLQPQSVALLSIHPQSDVPRVISTNRHFTQGAVELRNVAWDASSNMLQGTSLGPAATAHEVTIYVPRSYRWDSPQPEYIQELGEYSLRQLESGMLRLRVRFDDHAHTKWRVSFTRAN